MARNAGSGARLCRRRSLPFDGVGQSNYVPHPMIRASSASSQTPTSTRKSRLWYKSIAPKQSTSKMWNLRKSIWSLKGGQGQTNKALQSNWCRTQLANTAAVYVAWHSFATELKGDRSAYPFNNKRIIRPSFRENHTGVFRQLQLWAYKWRHEQPFMMPYPICNNANGIFFVNLSMQQ